jgi:uncharacterized LabA/DUF88 family protein
MASSSGLPPPPRWMQFIDGENLTITCQKLIEASGRRLKESALHKRNCFVWPAFFPYSSPDVRPIYIQGFPIRTYYYTSCVGSEEVLEDVRLKLWTIGFEPRVFKKAKQSQKTKAVDIALCTDMLSHAFRGNFEGAQLFAGDGDYVPLVEELKRLGKRVQVCFFGEGVSPALKLAADAFNDITQETQNWGNDAKNSVPLP